MFHAEGSGERPLDNRHAAARSGDLAEYRPRRCDEVPRQRTVPQPFLGDVATWRLRQVCHDARQELAVINALVERVISAQQLSAEHEADLSAVRQLVSALATTMRDVANAEAVAEPIDISALLRKVAAEIAAVDGAEITVAVNDGLHLSCVASQARRVVLNLVENARRAAGPNGWVELRAASVAGQLVIEIEDSGPGFGSAPPGLASIGLSVVHDWLAVAGGRLHIDDGAVGGALVQLWFSPAARSPAPNQQ